MVVVSDTAVTLLSERANVEGTDNQFSHACLTLASARRVLHAFRTG